MGRRQQDNPAVELLEEVLRHRSIRGLKRRTNNPKPLT